MQVDGHLVSKFFVLNVVALSMQSVFFASAVADCSGGIYCHIKDQEPQNFISNCREESFRGCYLRVSPKWPVLHVSQCSQLVFDLSKVTMILSICKPTISVETRSQPNPHRTLEIANERSRILFSVEEYSIETATTVVFNPGVLISKDQKDLQIRERDVRGYHNRIQYLLVSNPLCQQSSNQTRQKTPSRLHCSIRPPVAPGMEGGIPAPGGPNGPKGFIAFGGGAPATPPPGNGIPGGGGRGIPGMGTPMGAGAPKPPGRARRLL